MATAKKRVDKEKTPIKSVAMIPPFRNLAPALLSGVIFGCTDMTINECLTKQLFGLPGPHFAYVKIIHPGLPLFLFNYSKRQLHGIFKAASPGQMNINPYGWTQDGSKKTSFPAQVQICVRKYCRPLQESQFAPIIKGNYYSHSHFKFELDHAQVSKLIALFSTQVVAPSAVMVKSDWPIVNQNPSSLKTREAVEFNLSNAYDGATPCNESKMHLALSGSTSCLDETHQPLDTDLETTQRNEMDLIDEKLQKLGVNCGPFESYPSSPLQEVGNIIMMHSEDDDIPEQKFGQEENIKENLKKPSEIQSMIDELQVLKTFKQEAIKTMGLMQETQQSLLSEVQRLQDRCIRLEALSNYSEVSAYGTMDATSDPLLDQGGLIILAGGSDGVSLLASLDSYSPEKDVIKSLRPMSSIRSHVSLAKLNGDLYAVGGGNNDVWYNIVESYNPIRNHWTSLPYLNKPKGALAATTLSDKLFAIGGGNGLHCFSEVEMFDVNVGCWIFSRSMLQKRFGLAAVELNGAIYAVGGYDGKCYLSSAERFDPRENSWSRLESMKSKRACHSLVMLNEKLYAIGGYDGSSMVATVEVYDPRYGTWMDEAPMNYSRGYSATVALGDSIYAIGGMGENGEIVEKIEWYQEDCGWKSTSLKAVGKRSFASAIIM
ncbi:unnamed protein product [Amaranthus hypochondriacus]